MSTNNTTIHLTCFNFFLAITQIGFTIDEFGHRIRVSHNRKPFTAWLVQYLKNFRKFY